MRVRFKDIEEAFQFASADGGHELEAYLCKQTGKIYYRFELDDDLDELPDDIDDDDKFLKIPDKRELDLGKPLALDFASEFLADDFDDVRQFFRKKGAYGRFKALLERRGALDRWYAFEAQAEESALRRWCKLNSIELAHEVNNVALEALIASIDEKKAQLDRLRPLNPHALDDLEYAQNLELTYTSNAIEGNRLTQVETSLVIEEGVAIGGKKLKDHLEAIDHYEAIRYVRDAARRLSSPLTEFDIRGLHALVVKRADPDIAGGYAKSDRYVSTDAGRHHFPSPAEFPALMGDFAAWLGQAPATPETAFAAHRRLLDIHPFDDGNGRTARLLMNLILIRGGYPPVAVRPEDRLAYLRGLQQAQVGQGDEAFRYLLYLRLDASVGECLRALQEALPQARSNRSPRAS